MRIAGVADKQKAIVFYDNYSKWHSCNKWCLPLHAYAPSIFFYQYLDMKVTAADTVDFPEVLRMFNIEMKCCADRNTLVCRRQ